MSNPSNLDDRRDARFDDAMRRLHGAALASVSPQLRWKLRPAPAMTGGVAGHFGAWRAGAAYATAAAAVFAVAVGIGLRQPDTAGEAPPRLAVQQAEAGTVGVLEHDPDFFAWLASDDAALVAVE